MKDPADFGRHESSGHLLLGSGANLCKVANVDHPLAKPALDFSFMKIMGLYKVFVNLLELDNGELLKVISCLTYI